MELIKQMPDRLPNQDYTMDKDLSVHFLGQLAITSGHQGFNNNLEMIESFMKTIQEILFAQQEGEFNNPLTHKESEVVIKREWIVKLDQLWRKGLHCIIIRDPQNPIRITQRIVAYKMLEPFIKIKNREYDNPWEIMSPCVKCGKAIMYGFMENESFDVTETRCELVCSQCDMDMIVDEVEVKPPMLKMKTQREKSTNPIWVETKAQIPMRYAHETTPADILCSNEGGFFKEVGMIKIPRYNNSQEILMSTENTRFPSHEYYDDTMDMLYQEWLHYYYKAFVKAHTTVTNKFKLDISDQEKKPERKKMESA